MKTFTKALVGTVAAAAVAASTVTPALAQSRHHRDDDRIGAGEVVAGALIIGGIAALAAGANDRDGRYDRGYNRGWRGGSPRAAIQRCVSVAERQASRYSYGGRADVTDIRDIRRTAYGYQISGRIAVNSSGRGWRSGDHTYGRGWNNDYRGWNNGLRGYDAGSFTCRVDGNRVVDVDFRGIRGLR